MNLNRRALHPQSAGRARNRQFRALAHAVLRVVRVEREGYIHRAEGTVRHARSARGAVGIHGLIRAQACADAVAQRTDVPAGRLRFRLLISAAFVVHVRAGAAVYGRLIRAVRGVVDLIVAIGIGTSFVAGDFLLRLPEPAVLVVYVRAGAALYGLLITARGRVFRMMAAQSGVRSSGFCVGRERARRNGKGHDHRQNQCLQSLELHR